ncbi:hypothetical protein ACKWTF_016915 [Chironomus riparius]
MSETSKELLKSRKIFPIIQILGERGSGKRKILQSLADSLGIHVYYAECCDISSSLASQTEQKKFYILYIVPQTVNQSSFALMILSFSVRTMKDMRTRES